MSPLSPRKRPLQQRSKQRIQRIMETTKRLLHERTIDQVTTNLIAKESDVNVASLYQYFPNKQAIIYAIYEEWDQIVAGYDEIEDEYFLKEDWRAFFSRLPAQRYRCGLEFATEVNLDVMMHSNVELTKIETDHSEVIAERFVKYLKAYGSTWNATDLRELAFFLYELTFAAVYRFALQTKGKRTKTEHWATISYLALIEHCLSSKHAG